ncbi:MAG: M28 family peptidase [Porticoccaceae bacterium]|nr:M28 family peptidase [Porticoccaceae bacterium]
MIRAVFFLIVLSASCISFADSQTQSSFDGDRALAHIYQQVSFGPRTLDNPSAKAETLGFIASYLKPLATKLTIQKFSNNGMSGNNLWASFINPKPHANQRIMLGAHWDTRPISDQESDSSKQYLPTPGANDGGSGVAVLLELARIFAANPPPVSVDLVFFDLEDMGNIDNLPFAIGARAFVERNRFYRPSAGIIVDMVCDKNLTIPQERYSKTKASALIDQIWKIAARQNATVFSKDQGAYIQDDHLPFLEANIPVIDLIHYPFPDYWHTSEDTVDKCSSNSLEQVGNVILSLVYDAG